jgi:hypothetical protein
MRAPLEADQRYLNSYPFPRGKVDAAALDGERIEVWLEFEVEAMRHGVDPDVSRNELAALA